MLIFQGVRGKRLALFFQVCLELWNFDMDISNWPTLGRGKLLLNSGFLGASHSSNFIPKSQSLNPKLALDQQWLLGCFIGRQICMYIYIYPASILCNLSPTLVKFPHFIVYSADIFLRKKTRFKFQTCQFFPAPKLAPLLGNSFVAKVVVTRMHHQDIKVLQHGNEADEHSLTQKPRTGLSEEGGRYLEDYPN